MSTSDILLILTSQGHVTTKKVIDDVFFIQNKDQQQVGRKN